MSCSRHLNLEAATPSSNRVLKGELHRYLGFAKALGIQWNRLYFIHYSRSGAPQRVFGRAFPGSLRSATWMILPRETTKHVFQESPRPATQEAMPSRRQP